MDSDWAEEAMIIFVARSLPENFREILKTHRFGYVALSYIQGYFCRDDEKTWLGADPSRDAVEFANILRLSDNDRFLWIAMLSIQSGVSSLIRRLQRLCHLKTSIAAK